MTLKRRELLRAGLVVAAGGAALSAAGAALAMPETSVRRLGFNHLHTGETLDIAYWENGAYVPSALVAVNHVLRDWRTDTTFPIDPRLLDLLAALQGRLGTSGRYEVICGYRSPTTNAMLHERSNEVAVHSLHMAGQAIDIRLAGVDLERMRDTAMGLAVGGVGYYANDFVHVDVGRVRHWAG
jgi:uncharacterized protein YcbK (DUF882 family)